MRNKMKTRGFVMIVLALALMLAAQFAGPTTNATGYSAVLISPRAGQVLHPGQRVKVQWRSQLPDVPNLGACESEVWLSVDGGATYPTNVSYSMDPRAQYVYWTVPNLPTNQAVMDIRFGCELPNPYPETLAPQPASIFAIAKPTDW
jgi:hypothetical protein